MFDRVTARIVAWVQGVAPYTEILTTAPGDAHGDPAVSCHLLDLTNGTPRPGSLRQTSLELRYLVTVRGPDVAAGHRLLGDLVGAALASTEFRMAFSSGQTEMWRALRIAPRPCFFLLALIDVDSLASVAPRVSEPVEVRVSALAGRRGRAVPREIAQREA